MTRQPLQAVLDNIHGKITDLMAGADNGGGGGGGEVISLTYAQLKANITANALTPGTFYLITDFQTIYKQPETNVVMSGAVEPILVTAQSVNTLKPLAFSPSNPQDVLYYNPTNNNTAMYQWATSTDKGQIYRRETGKGNDLPYDTRAIKFRRYQLNVTTAWSSSTSYAVGASVAHSDNVWIARQASTNQAPADGSAYWSLVGPIAGAGSYLGLNTSGLTVYIGSTSYIVPVSSSVYQDFYTFDDGSGNSTLDTTNVHSNKIGTYVSSGIQRLNNNVFMGNSFYGNTVGNDFYNNTVGNNFRSNTVGNYFNSNTVGNYFYNNTVGNNFYNNTVGNDFCNNTVGNIFCNNTVGNNFYYNTVGNNFRYNNAVGNYFYYNTVGHDFYNNTVGNYFYGNTVGNYFGNNTVGNNFHSNTVGNYFNSNTVGNDFRYNKFGERFQNQNMAAYNTTSSNLLRHNEFGSGICVAKSWGTSQSAILLDDRTVYWSATGNTATVAFYYQGTNGAFATGTI